MKTRVRIDRTVAATEDAFQFRNVLKDKRKASAAARFHQRTFNYRRRPASYTFHNVNISKSYDRGPDTIFLNACRADIADQAEFLLRHYVRSVLPG